MSADRVLVWTKSRKGGGWRWHSTAPGLVAALRLADELRDSGNVMIHPRVVFGQVADRRAIFRKNSIAWEGWKEAHEAYTELHAHDETPTEALARIVRGLLEAGPMGLRDLARRAHGRIGLVRRALAMIVAVPEKVKGRTLWRLP